MHDTANTGEPANPDNAGSRGNPASTRITRVWILTCALTLVSWGWAAASGGDHLTPNAPETLAVLAICAVKAWFIIQHFMEVRSAPRWLRHCTNAWLVALWATFVAMYLY